MDNITKGILLGILMTIVTQFMILTYFAKKRALKRTQNQDSRLFITRSDDTIVMLTTSESEINKQVMSIDEAKHLVHLMIKAIKS